MTDQAIAKREHWLARGLAYSVLALPRLSMWRSALGIGSRWLREHGGLFFSVNTHDGLKLHAVYVPAPQAAGGAQKARLPVMIAHGYTETKEVHLHTAAMLLEHGHGVLLFDQRGHGRSWGTYTSFGVDERRDLAAVLDKSLELGYLADKAITLGFSLGGGVVLQHAAADERVAGVVAIAPFADLERAVKSYRRLYAPWLSEPWLIRGLHAATMRLGFHVEEASTLRAIEELTIPILLAVGDRDCNLSLERHTQILADAARRCRDCQLLCIPGAAHVNIRSARWHELDQAILAFLDKVQQQYDQAQAG